MPTKKLMSRDIVAGLTIRSWGVRLGFIALGVAVLFAAAKVQVPFYPVPMTLQIGAVMALALGYGPRLALASFVAYLALGAFGFPVFADSPARGTGLGYMLGPTGGYLIGMLLASGLVGVLAEGRGPLGRLFAMLAGLAVVYALGFSWLVHFVGAPHKAFVLGVVRFLPGDLVKIALVAVAAELLHGYLPKARA